MLKKMPARAATAPATNQVVAKIRPTGIPRARAVSWLELVARMATPSRVLRIIHQKLPRVMAPAPSATRELTSTRAGPTSTAAVGSQGVGMPTGSAPQTSSTMERRIIPIKMVTMIVTKTGRPMSGRRTRRSMPAPNSPVPVMAPSSAAGQGQPAVHSPTIKKLPAVRSSPRAKLNT